MIVFVVFLIFTGLTLGYLGFVLVVCPRPTRHQRCLANIARLERELFPEWFAPPPKVDWCSWPHSEQQ